MIKTFFRKNRKEKLNEACVTTFGLRKTVLKI